VAIHKVRPVLVRLTVAGLAAGLLVLPAASAHAAVTCPTVSPQGQVSPAPQDGVDWASCDLSGADLSQAPFANATLTGAKLTGANLSKADLENATLSSATLTGANLSHAVVDSSTFNSADLTGVDLTGTSWGFA
jgi:uncharacterized protein YjbI with pentapeptide repeats